MTNPRDHDTHPLRVPGGQATDSHRVPWSGRELSPTGFETDTGAADPAVLTLLADPERSPEADQRLMAALAGARFVVAIVAEPTEVDRSGPLAMDTRVDMAAVTLVAPDGQRALPVFSGVEALARWDPQARPVPVTPARAGQAALEEQCEVMVVDVAGPATRVLRSSMIWALALEHPWLPAHIDPVVLAAVEWSAGEEASVTAYAVSPGADGALSIELTLPPGLPHPEVQALAVRIGERLATDPQVRTRLDGVAFRVARAVS